MQTAIQLVTMTITRHDWVWEWNDVEVVANTNWSHYIALRKRWTCPCGSHHVAILCKTEFVSSCQSKWWAHRDKHTRTHTHTHRSIIVRMSVRSTERWRINISFSRWMPDVCKHTQASHVFTVQFSCVDIYYLHKPIDTAFNVIILLHVRILFAAPRRCEDAIHQMCYIQRQVRGSPTILDAYWLHNEINRIFCDKHTSNSINDVSQSFHSSVKMARAEAAHQQRENTHIFDVSLLLFSLFFSLFEECVLEWRPFSNEFDIIVCCVYLFWANRCYASLLLHWDEQIAVHVILMALHAASTVYPFTAHRLGRRSGTEKEKSESQRGVAECRQSTNRDLNCCQRGQCHNLCQLSLPNWADEVEAIRNESIVCLCVSKYSQNAER